VTRSKPLWIFLHIPKCGGTTFKAHVERHLALEDEFFEFSNWGREFRATKNIAAFEDRSVADRAKAVVLAGHHVRFGIHRLVPGDREARYFCVLRDPAERCVSLYNYRWSRGHAPDDFNTWYEGWYRPKQSNFQCRFLSERLFHSEQALRPEQQLAMAKKLLSLCWFVTTTDNWDAGLNHIFADMGLPLDWQHYRKAGTSMPLPDSHPASGEIVRQRVELNAAFRQRIESDSPLDVELVRWVRGNRDSKRQ
jgi:Sulfotransferase family